MNWTDDQIEKLIMFYLSRPSLFLVPEIWHLVRKSVSEIWRQFSGTGFWRRFLVRVSLALGFINGKQGRSQKMGHGYMCVVVLTNRLAVVK